MAKIKMYIEIERSGTTETRGIEGDNDEDIRFWVKHFNLTHGSVKRVLNEKGGDVTSKYKS